MSLSAAQPRPPDVRSAPTVIGPRSERQLFCLWRDGDIGAREELVHRFLPLTRRLAGRYRHSGLSQDDLDQVASLGLLKAIDRYDSDAGPFVSYAVPNIVGELKRHFRDKGWAMRIPRSLQERFLEVNQAVEELSGQLGRSPTPTDIAGHMGLDVELVVEALEAASAYSPTPLDAPRHGDDDGARTLGDSLGAEDPHYGFVDIGQALAPTFRALPAREQQILKLRFIDDLTQSEIAEQIGISQMHVSRLLRRALDKLGASGDSTPSGRSTSPAATT
jgi:RNA polymerase sigma-B factor